MKFKKHIASTELECLEYYEEAIIKLIVSAQYFSDLAKYHYHEKYENYEKKSFALLKAISILKSIKTNFIDFKVETNVPDQNGYDSNIFYFEIALPSGTRQCSFHSFEKNLCNCGNQKIKWDGEPNSSRETAKLLNSLYNLNYNWDFMEE